MELTSLDIVLFVISVFAIVIGLLLSNNGSGGGIAALSGQDIELFRKVKSRGFKKYIQIAMFVLGISMIIITFTLLKIRDVAPTPEPEKPEPETGETVKLLANYIRYSINGR